MTVHTHNAGYLLSAFSAQGTGAPVDTRHCADYGFLWYQMSGQSGVFTLQASHNLTAWHDVIKLTATATQTGTAQIVGYFPYIRGSAGPMYTGTGGQTSATAALWMAYSPGVK
jgi:hypothetical protein